MICVRDLRDGGLLSPHPWAPTKMPIINKSNLIYFTCNQSFDQKLGSPLFVFFSLKTAIWPKYRVLFHLFFLQCTTIWPKIKFFFDIFFSFARGHSTKYMIFFISFILSLCTTIRPKNSVLFNLLFLSVHDYSTKLEVTLTLLFVVFLDVAIFILLYSWQILPLYFHRSVSGSTFYFVCYIHSSTTYIFRTLYS